MKKTEELKPNYAPVYAAALYPELAKIFQSHGYALACHGSLARDFDLIAVPWADEVSKPDAVMKEITGRFSIRQIGEPEDKKHYRLCYTISVGHGECAIDLSFVALPDVFVVSTEDVIADLHEAPREPVGRDKLFDGAAYAVRMAGKATPFILIKHLGISYGRASALIDQLEAAGIIGKEEARKPRKVLL